MLNDHVRETTSCLLSAFGIRTPVLFSSDLNVAGKKDELVLNVCKAVGATHYLSGPLGRDDLREEYFEQAGIAVYPIFIAVNVALTGAYECIASSLLGT